jgi:hypothetical protein
MIIRTNHRSGTVETWFPGVQPPPKWAKDNIARRPAAR